MPTKAKSTKATPKAKPAAKAVKAKAASLAVAAAGFPTNQSVIIPGAGNGNIGLYFYSGTTLSISYQPNGNSQVFFGQNYTTPTTPLPAGVSTFPVQPGFNMTWSSSGGGFKLVWGVS